ncbi:MAG: sulfatase-like hydrolase/transferase, partial [Akkermansiaceae bacterium]|nr:sulfatase-like hydrolase/transferase [Akkermansiaceae bacterium]
MKSRFLLIFTLLSSLFTLPALAEPPTTAGSASSSGQGFEGKASTKKASSGGRQFEDKVFGRRASSGGQRSEGEAFGRRASSTKPNVITIITDDQGWGDIGYNNPGKVYTPNLDALAAESAVCTRHYSMPQCTPTRIAAFTGRYPGRFGNAGLTASNEPVFPHGTLNLATFLKA